MCTRAGLGMRPCARDPGASARAGRERQMEHESFSAMVVDEADGHVAARLRQMERGQLPAGDVLVRVRYSSVNYKDGLALTGQGRVIRQYPGIPGIDLAGRVEESTSDQFVPGDEVVMTGCGP